MPRRKGKRKNSPNQCNSKGQKLAWTVIIYYVTLLIALLLVHPSVEVVKWEPLGAFAENSERWLILVAASVVLFSLIIKQDQEPEQLQVADTGILVGAAATFIAAFLAFKGASALEGILLLVLSYPVIMAGTNYWPFSRRLQIAVTVIAVASALLLLSGILHGIIEALLFIVYLSIAPVVMILWLWVIAIVNGRRDI